MPPVNKAKQASSSEESIKLLEASKRWRAEFKRIETGDKTLEALSRTINGALDDIVNAQVGAMEQLKIVGGTARLSAKGADLAQQMAKEAITKASENEAQIISNQEIADKHLRDLEARSKAAMSQIQKLELAKTETTIIAKGIGMMSLGKESQDDLRRALNMAFQQLNVGNLEVQHARRMQRVKGDKGVAPAALKVKLTSVADKLKLYEAMRRMTSQGMNINYEFQNEVPPYALNSHKQLHKVALEIRKIDKKIKTRVSMVKGEAWPQLRIKRRGQAKYEQAPKELVDLARQNMIKAKKALAADRRAQNESRILYEEEDMELGSNADPRPSGSATAAGRTDQAENANLI